VSGLSVAFFQALRATFFPTFLGYAFQNKSKPPALAGKVCSLVGLGWAWLRLGLVKAWYGLVGRQEGGSCLPLSAAGQK